MVRASPSTGRLLAPLLLSALCAAAGAQSYAAQVFGEPDGLPHQQIDDVAQAADGRLWFATRHGVACFDSCEWAVDDPWPDAPRTRLCADQDGVVHAFTLAPPYRHATLVAGEWRQQEMTVRIDDGQRGVIDAVATRRDDGTHLALLTRSGTLLLQRGGRWTEHDLGVDDAFGLAVEPTRLLVAHARGVSSVAFDDAERRVRDVAATRDGAVLAVCYDPHTAQSWLLRRRGIDGLRGEQVVRYLERDDNLFFPNVWHVTLLPDERGGVYFGEQNGASHFHPDEGLERIRDQSGLDQIGVTCMLRDREGVIWAGGVRGVARFLGRAIANRSALHGLGEAEVASILQLRDGRVVLGHNSSLTILEDRPRVLSVGNDSHYSRLMAMVQDDDGRIVAAANQRGLLRIDPDTLVVEEIGGPPDTGVRSVQFVARDAAGRVIVAGWQQVFRLEDDRLVPLATQIQPDDDDYIRHVHVDGDDLWVSMRNHGVLRLSGATRRWFRSDVLARNNVVCTSARSDGAAWVGTGVGLMRTTPDGGLEPLLLGGEAIHRPVYFIVDDRDGNTWFGTDNGVFRWTGEELRHLTLETGLVGRETNRGAGICDAEGHLWFGFDRGASTLYPERIARPRHGPRVSFLPALVDGMPAHGWPDIEDHRSVTFRLRSLSTRDGPLLSHSYRLEGRDGDWSPWRALPDRSVDFVSLPAGDYRLHVRVVDTAGLGHAAATEWLHVMPPWWQRGWFFALATAASLALSWAAAAFLTQRRTARALALAIDERTHDLRAERNRLRATLTSIAEGLVVLDAEDRVAVWNPAATALTGWDEQSAGGRPLAELLPMLDLTAPPAEGEAVEVTAANGSRRWFEFTVAPLADGAASGRVLAFRDVTQRRTQERLVTRNERLESLGVLAGGIAHDFNNLLTVMLGNLSLLEPESTPQQAEHHDQIRGAVMRARDLTQQLLTFSKGGAPVRRLASLHDVVVDSSRLALSGANVRSRFELADDLHPVEIDNGQISQVVHNLVLNARQAMPDGGTLTLRTYNADRGPDGATRPFAVIEVRDEGSGIRPADLEHIFDPYYSTKPQGSGLGLATSHSIVKRHDGALTVESALGVGSTFRVFLPAATRRPQLQKVGAAPAAPPRRAPLRVLCMDDDPGIRLFLDKSLRSLGHRATIVEDGADAVREYREAIARGDAFDAVLLDLTVPGGMGGIETLQALRRLNPNVTAIAATGYSTEPVIAQSREHGFRGALVKPFGLRDLDGALQRARAAADSDTA